MDPNIKTIPQSKHFEKKYEFPSVLENPLNKFREKWKSADFGPKKAAFPHFEYKNFPLKSLTVTFNHFSLHVTRCHFRKIWWTDIEKGSKMLILGTKSTYPILG